MTPSTKPRGPDTAVATNRMMAAAINQRLFRMAGGYALAAGSAIGR